MKNSPTMIELKKIIELEQKNIYASVLMVQHLNGDIEVVGKMPSSVKWCVWLIGKIFWLGLWIAHWKHELGWKK